MDDVERAFLETTMEKMELDAAGKERVKHFEGSDEALDLVRAMPLEQRQALRDDLVGATLADGKIDALEQLLMKELSESLDV
jgi:uncharacterized tellurite resistance protein B-like protein